MRCGGVESGEIVAGLRSRKVGVLEREWVNGR